MAASRANTFLYDAFLCELFRFGPLKSLNPFSDLIWWCYLCNQLKFVPLHDKSMLNHLSLFHLIIPVIKMDHAKSAKNSHQLFLTQLLHLTNSNLKKDKKSIPVLNHQSILLKKYCRQTQKCVEMFCCFVQIRSFHSQKKQNIFGTNLSCCCDDLFLLVMFYVQHYPSS